ncbi:MAG: four-carbon acid sugar kinase family protein [Proteobacteria bacterium]|nr:four-carbon acid sugar kinase family protein [Pseudomonadota bacterium]
MTTRAASPAADVPRVAILADDLTGAGDTLVQFVQRGWNGLLQRGPETPPLGPRAALSRPLHTRAMPDAQARETTAQAVVQTLAVGIAQVYLKIDSTLRGSVAAQLDGALAAWRRTHPDAFVVLCPAYPAMGRTQHDGQLFVNGTPLADSPAGRDPVTPVTSSHLTDLVPGSVVVPACERVADWTRTLTAAARSHAVVVAEADNDVHLRTLAAAVASLGSRALPAGSAGFALPLAAAWLGAERAPPAAVAEGAPSDANVLVVVTSANEVSRRQVDALQAHLGAQLVVRQARAADLADVASAERWAMAPTPAHVIVLQAPAEREETPDAAIRRERGQRVARAIAVAARGALTQHRIGRLVLVGGDGAEAVLDALDAQVLRMIGTVQEGVPLATVMGGPCDGLPVATKAGGFGHDRTLLEVVQSLQSLTTKPEVSR